MSGTIVRDALAPQLLAGATLTGTSTTQGTVVELNYPGRFGVYVLVGTVTGTDTPTLEVELEASNSSTFASGVVSLGRFDRITTTAAVHQMSFYTNKRYVRTQVTPTGTTPVFTGTTATVVPEWDRFSATSHA